jgi:hypothetical protein
MSTNGVVCGTSDNEIPGTLNDWQKYCTLGDLAKFNWNLLGCRKLGLLGFRLVAVIDGIYAQKKEDSF